MKVLITGGVGFIGQHLARHLGSDHDLVALDSLLPQVHLDPEGAITAFPGRVVRGDVSDPDAWTPLEAWRPEVVVHLAAETGTAQSMYETDRYRRVNVEGTRLAAEFARRVGARVVSMSSRAVYGEGRHLLADGTSGYGGLPQGEAGVGAVPAASLEDDPHLPVSFYGETKSEAEAVVRPFASEVPVAILRPQNVVGPGQALHNPYTGVLAAFLARLREGRSLQVYGDGHQTRDFVQVSDVAAMVAWLATTHDRVGVPLVLNCGTGTRTSLLDLARHAATGVPADARHSEVAIEHVDVHRAGDIEHACADVTRAREVGAPLPQISSAEAISGFIANSWTLPGASSQAWDDALGELDRRGLTS